MLVVAMMMVLVMVLMMLAVLDGSIRQSSVCACHVPALLLLLLGTIPITLSLRLQRLQEPTSDMSHLPSVTLGVRHLR
jgi:hypothetical protein